MVRALLGKKLGTTQVFDAAGQVQGVTAVKVGPCTVVQVKSQGKDGYEAVQLGFAEVKHLDRPLTGHMKRVGLFRHLKEVAADDLSQVQVGQKFDVSLFQVGELVDVIGASKGRGFAGVVKRHHFKGGPKTHGQSDRMRAPGSVGSNTNPGRVIKGLRMAGHMGNEQVTVRNLQVVMVDKERDLLLVKGAVPGPNNGLLVIRRAKSKAK